MVFPFIFSWIEKAGEFAAWEKNCAHVATLADVAWQAAIRKVFFGCFSTMFDANDMVNLTAKN
jgi:hypothetical protein